MSILPKNFRKNSVIWNEIQSPVVTLFEACQLFGFYLGNCLVESLITLWLCTLTLLEATPHSRKEKKKTSAHQNVIFLAIEK